MKRDRYTLPQNYSHNIFELGHLIGDKIGTIKVRDFFERSTTLQSTACVTSIPQPINTTESTCDLRVAVDDDTENEAPPREALLQNHLRDQTTLFVKKQRLYKKRIADFERLSKLIDEKNIRSDVKIRKEKQV